MKVEWTEFRPLTDLEMDWFPEQIDPGITYKGEVISSHKSFWGTTYLVVACDDHKIREVEMNKVDIIKHVE